jgi:hypothetical protein
MVKVPAGLYRPVNVEHLLINISTGIRDSCSQAKPEASQGNACEIAQNSL